MCIMIVYPPLYKYVIVDHSQEDKLYYLKDDHQILKERLGKCQKVKHERHRYMQGKGWIPLTNIIVHQYKNVRI